MKTLVLFILIIQSYFTISLFAQTQSPINFGKLMFQNKVHFVHYGTVGVSMTTKQATQSKARVREIFHQMRESNIHPFSWQASAPPDIVFIFPVSGDLSEIYEAINEYGYKSKPSWIWNDVRNREPVVIKIYLDSVGDGYVELYQFDQLVGSITCKSGVRAKQPQSGVWVVKEKCMGLRSDEYGRVFPGSNKWMPWALEIQNPNPVCHLHGESLKSSSEGCVVVPRRGAKIIYDLAKQGSKIVIVYL